MKTVLFDSPIEVYGGFYVSISKPFYHDYTPTLETTTLSTVIEHYNRPYLINRPARKKINGIWEDVVTIRTLPLMFPVIEPECERPENVIQSLGPSGCLRAAWDTLPRQHQWVVALTDAAGDTLQIDTVSTNRWAHCGLDPDGQYTVSVRSRCDNLLTYSWSDWQRYGSSSGVEPVEHGETWSITPNPTDGILTLHHQAMEGTVTVADLQGRVLLSAP